LAARFSHGFFGEGWSGGVVGGGGVVDWWRGGESGEIAGIVVDGEGRYIVEWGSGNCCGVGGEVGGECGNCCVGIWWRMRRRKEEMVLRVRVELQESVYCLLFHVFFQILEKFWQLSRVISKKLRCFFKFLKILNESRLL
jgi:hypothetical protein